MTSTPLHAGLEAAASSYHAVLLPPPSQTPSPVLPLSGREHEAALL